MLRFDHGDDDTLKKAENDEWKTEAVDVVELALIRSRDNLDPTTSNDGVNQTAMRLFNADFVYQQFGES